MKINVYSKITGLLLEEAGEDQAEHVIKDFELNETQPIFEGFIPDMAVKYGEYRFGYSDRWSAWFVEVKEGWMLVDREKNVPVEIIGFGATVSGLFYPAQVAH